jgi:hypothetical protein
VFTVADQYIKKARPSQVAVSALGKNFLVELFAPAGGERMPPKVLTKKVSG